MLGQRTVDHRVREQPGRTLAGHDERPPRFRALGVHRGRIVGDVAHPLLLGLVPRNARARPVPWSPVDVGGSPVVQDPAIQRPAPCPAGEEPHSRGVVFLHVLRPGPALHEIAALRIAAGVDPVAGRRRAVVFQLGERVQALLGRQVEPVDLLRELIQLRLGGILVVERERHDRRRELAAFVAIQLLHPLEQFGEDPVIVAGLSLGWQDLILPLRPAAAIHERAVLLDPVRRRDHEDFGLDRFGICVRAPPELRAGGRQRVHHGEPLEIAERLQHLIRIRADARGRHP